MWSRLKTKSTQGWLAARSYQARQVIRTWVIVRAHCCASIIITGTSWATVALVLRYWHFHYCLNVLGVATEARFFADIHQFRKISRQTNAEICRVNSWLFPLQYVVTVMKEYCNTLLLYLSALANQLYAILSVKCLVRGQLHTSSTCLLHCVSIWTLNLVVVHGLWGRPGCLPASLHACHWWCRWKSTSGAYLIPNCFNPYIIQIDSLPIDSWNNLIGLHSATSWAACFHSHMCTGISFWV